MLVVGGLSGLLREWLGWFQLFGFLGRIVPEGYELPANLGYVAVGLALAGVSAVLGRRQRD